MPKPWSQLLIFVFFACATEFARAQVIVSPPNYSVTTPVIASGFLSDYEFSVNGQSSGDPPGFATNDSVNFSLSAGATYIFSMNTDPIHPVDITVAPDISPADYFSGASAQIVDSGTVKVTIPATNYPTNLYYICNNHLFYGIITVNPPQPPPLATILNTSVTTNITLTFSGGTNTIQLVPQFSSNLVKGVWLPVPSYTNTYSGNGTNTTSFGRLDAICGPDVFIRISQAAN